MLCLALALFAGLGLLAPLRAAAATPVAIDMNNLASGDGYTYVADGNGKLELTNSGSSSGAFVLANLGSFAGEINLGDGVTATVPTGGILLNWEGIFTGTGALEINTNLMRMRGENTCTGPITLKGSTDLCIGESNRGSIAAGVMVEAGATLIFGRDDDLRYDGVISGTGSVKKWGRGTLTLSGDISGLSGATARLEAGGTGALVLATQGPAFRKAELFTKTGANANNLYIRLAEPIVPQPPAITTGGQAATPAPSPQTGDGAQPGAWLPLAALCVAGLVAIRRRRAV